MFFLSVRVFLSTYFSRVGVAQVERCIHVLFDQCVSNGDLNGILVCALCAYLYVLYTYRYVCMFVDVYVYL